MFSECLSLKDINISNFNTNKVTNMGRMFENCPLLNKINLSNINTDNVIDMRAMFYNCSDILKMRIRRLYKHIKDEVFHEFPLYF